MKAQKEISLHCKSFVNIHATVENIELERLIFNVLS